MKKMSKLEKNEAIAKILGFNFTDKYCNIRQWDYPKKWDISEWKMVSPVTHIPDFIEMINFAKKMYERLHIHSFTEDTPHKSKRD